MINRSFLSGIAIGALTMSIVGSLALYLTRDSKVQEEPLEPEWAMKIGKISIEPDDFSSEWQRKVDLLQKPLSQEDFVDILYEEWMGFEAARVSGFLESEDMQRDIRQLVGSKYKRVLLDRKRNELKGPDLSDPSLRAEYNLQQERWTRPAGYLIGWLTWESSEKAQPEKIVEAETKVKSWRDMVDQHADPKSKFAELCRMHSSDSISRYFGGELGWKNEDELRSEFGQAADNILDLKNVGEVTPVTRIGNLLMFFQLRGYRESSLRPFAEVIPVIRDERIRESELKIETAMRSDLTQMAPIKKNPSVLSKIESPKPPKPIESPGPMAN